MGKIINEDFELGWLWMSFHNEQVRLLPLIDKENHNDFNRAYIRSLFSMIEGITFRTRQILLQRHNENIITLNADQIIALSEKSVELGNNGSIKKRQKYYDFKSMMLFTYKTYCECFNKHSIYDKFVSEKRYNDFLESIKMRNRITHPKTGMDVFINGDNIKKVMSAGDWYHEFTLEIFMGDLLKQE